MNSRTFHNIIQVIMESKSPGFGFVDDMIEYLTVNSVITGVRRAAVVWHLSYDGKSTNEYVVYAQNDAFNIRGINYKRIYDLTEPLFPSSPNINMIVDNRFFWMDRFAIIPIYNYLNQDELLNIIGWVILVFEEANPSLSKDQILLLNTILNNKEPIIFQNEKVIDAFGCFQKSKSAEINSVDDRFSEIISAMQELSFDNNFERNSGLRYYSFWKLNDNSDIGKGPLIKEFSWNTYSDKGHTKTHRLLKNSDLHYVNDYIQSVKDDIRSGETDTPIGYFNFNQIKSSLSDEEYFKQLGLNERTCTVIVLPLYSEFGIKSTEICCLYVSNIFNTPFLSKRFLAQYMDKMMGSIVSRNQIVESKLVDSLMQQYGFYENPQAFYKKASELISQYNSAEDCLIYMFDEREELLNVTEETANDPSGQPRNALIGQHHIYLPTKYIQDSQFVERLRVCQMLDDGNFYCQIYQEPQSSNLVKSYLFLLIRSRDSLKEIGLLILINKKSKNDVPCALFNNALVIDNLNVTELSASFLFQFDIWNKAISNRNYLLKKLRHEIPSCTHVIENNGNKIKRDLEKKQPLPPHISNYLNELSLANDRVKILSEFFSTVDFDDSRFAEDRIQYDLAQMFRSQIDNFRTEGYKRGVDVYFIVEDDCPFLYVSNFFVMAIRNIISNAVKYAAPGSCVHVHAYSDKIEISDAGVGIHDDELDLIFKEGYRGREVIDVEQRGMGYGLFLSKRVFNAHNSEISVLSRPLYEENVYAELSIARFISGMTPKERDEFIFRTTIPAERNTALTFYDKIKKLKPQDYDARFINTEKNILLKWMDYEEKNGSVFFEMINAFFLKPVNEVTFTILLNEENSAF